MPELSHDTADDGFHEIQLSGKQLVFLFIVTTTVIVVVFLCGVKVGRGARLAQGEEPDPSATAATAPAPVPDAGPLSAEPPAPPSETPDALSYPRSLNNPGPADALKTPDEATSQAAQIPRPAPPAATARSAPAAAESAGVPVAGRPGTWVVQVIATRDRSIATSVVQRLAAKGYTAFLVNPPPGQPFYKVHVGRFNDRGDAEKVSSRITKEEQFQSWITR